MTTDDLVREAAPDPAGQWALLRDVLDGILPADGSRILLSQVGIHLGKRGFVLAETGHAKLKDALVEVTDLCELIPDPAIPARIAVRRRSAIASPVALSDASSVASPVPAPPASAAPKAQLDPDPELGRFAFIPPSSVEHPGIFEWMDRMYSPKDRIPELADQRLMQVYLAESWRKAVRSGAVFASPDCVAFDTGLVATSGEPILAVFEPNRIPDRQPWILHKILTPSRFERTYGINPHVVPAAGDETARELLASIQGAANPAQEPRPLLPERFEHFAVHPNFFGCMARLESQALPESWTFPEGAGGPRSILRNFLIYTYQRLRYEGKIVISENRDLAVFHTGLAGRRLMRPIYACYEPNPDRSPDAPPWRLTDFIEEGTGPMGRRIATELPEKPRRAAYFQSAEELVLLLPPDRDPDITIRYEHIVGERLDRLPAAYLQERLHTRPDLLAMIAENRNRSEDERNRIYLSIGNTVFDDMNLALKITEDLDKAVSRALRNLRWNFRTAVPFYYPTQARMNFLLPLALVDVQTPDLALVVEMTASGNLLAPTVFTMEMAYTCARLVNRPESDWLRPEKKPISGEGAVS